jgi:Ca-activated chloride channel family protein
MDGGAHEGRDDVIAGEEARVKLGDGANGLLDAAHALAKAAPRDLELGRPFLLLTLIGVAGVMGALALSRARPSLAFARTDDVGRLPKGRGHVARWLAFAFVALALTLMGVAAAEPRVVGEPDPGTTEGIDLVVALDISGSMRAADFRPNDRLYVAKQVIAEHLFSRVRDRIGLVVFAGEAFTQSPLTHDKALLRTILDGVRTGVIQDGTAIGDGLGLSLARLKDSTAKTRAVILLTDGDNNSGMLAPESSADLAAELGVKVFPILVGRGGKVPFPDGTDIFGAVRYVQVEMPTNPALLKKIAERTGGSFFSATDPQALVSSFTKILDSLDRSLLEGAPVTRKKISLQPLFLLPAALLLCAGLSLAFTRASAVP